MNDFLKELRDGRAGAIGVAAADEIERLNAELERIAQYCGNRGAAIQSVAHMARAALKRTADNSEPPQ